MTILVMTTLSSTVMHKGGNIGCFLTSSLTIVVVLDNFAPPGPIVVPGETLLGEPVLLLHLAIVTAVYLQRAENHLANCHNL